MLTKNDVQRAIDAEFSGDIADVCDPPFWVLQRAEHPGFRLLADTVPTHLTPERMLEGSGFGAVEDWSVLSIALPRNERIVAEIAASTGFPPKSWFSSKIVKMRALPRFGEALVARLAAMGTDAFVAPGETRRKTAVNAEGTRFENTWSERHVGYVCGLGTFGLHGGLITERGCTHRLLSLMLKARFPEYGMMHEDPFGNCLHHAGGTCGECVARCPAEAVQEAGHDPMRCRDHTYIKNRARVRDEYGLEMPGCALCLTGVPCSRTNPMRSKGNVE